MKPVDEAGVGRLDLLAGGTAGQVAERDESEIAGGEHDDLFVVDWHHPSGVGTDGFEKMFVGLNARAINFARFGWLYLNEGRSGDDQIVPAEFVDEATRLDTTTDPASEYQYLWWIDEARSSFYANGDHGQFI